MAIRVMFRRLSSSNLAGFASGRWSVCSAMALRRLRRNGRRTRGSQSQRMVTKLR
eukprot:CAMPEP_0170280440 /NCGR_PEP_ID=MMETSP0116_2-20130129/40233_1 /TAXON_ID=400756 /ORGANISM="Durinskia baltica, Strain CSIRO CS-38" /LENGTH=54 /DNA_ID=CAMNT_0010531769 /DNA_START=185 /DNA_END=345 /DNA_ORIENTATION=-